jgi:hypothetical protein
MQDSLTTGTTVADEASAEPAIQRPLVNLEGLLQLFPKRSGGRGPAVHSAAAKFLMFIGSTPQDTPIHLLESEQERFVDYLKSRHHTPDTVRSYRFCINLLLKAARERGWQTPPQILPPDWATVMALARPKEVQSIVRFAARIKPPIHLW